LGKDLNKDALAVDLTRAQLDALRSLVSKVVQAGTPLTKITRRDFSHPALDATMEKALDDVRGGFGLLFVRGIDVADYTTDELRILFMGLSTYFGKAVSQSKFGDFMGEVTPVPGREDSRRGYVLDKELGFHSDHSELFGLFCIVDAQEGGENVFASSLKIYELIQQEHPEYIPILERGWLCSLVDEQPLGMGPITPHRVPMFSTVDGVRSHFGAVNNGIRTAKVLGETLSDQELGAIQFYKVVRERPELHFTAALKPGEAVFINNYEILHSRKAFTHWPDRKRHLLRLWLEGDATRPMVPELPLYRFMNKDGSQGVSAIPQPELDLQIAAVAADPLSQRLRSA